MTIRRLGPGHSTIEMKKQLWIGLSIAKVKQIISVLTINTQKEESLAKESLVQYFRLKIKKPKSLWLSSKSTNQVSLKEKRNFSEKKSKSSN